MIEISKNQQNILLIFIKSDFLSSSDIHSELLKGGEDIALITVKRELSELKTANLLEVFGAGRSVKYKISSYGRLLTNINAKEYCAVEPDKRFGLHGYNFELLKNFPKEVFSDSELKEMTDATVVYRKNALSLSKTLEGKELERFVIELSWKSSRIEGNTYNLLDTEKLIREGIEAIGHDKNEARMILNHKEAFKFVKENLSFFKELTLPKIEEVHKILIKDLNVDYGLRAKAVGVTGSIYKPIDNMHQIKESVESLCNAVNTAKSSYAKALIALLGISYIQPFEDGNKRTSRLVANALLLSYDCAPLSYRSVDENEYREAIMVFYELNSILPFRKIFLDQYLFASKNYSVKG